MNKNSRKSDSVYSISTSKNNYILSLSRTSYNLTIFAQVSSVNSAEEPFNYESSFSYGELVDIERKLKGFEEIEEIFQLLQFFIEKGNFEIKNESESCLALIFPIYLRKTIIRISLKTINYTLTQKEIEKLTKELNIVKAKNLELTETLEKIKNQNYSDFNFNKLALLMKEIALKQAEEIKNMTIKNLKASLKNESFERGTLIRQNSSLLNSTLRESSKIEKEEIKCKDYLSTIKLEKILDVDDSWIFSLCLLKDGRLASSSADGKIKVFDLATYHCDINIVSDQKISIYHICLLDNGLLASSSADGTLKIWKIEKNTYKFIISLKGHNGIVNKAIQLSSNRIGSCSYDNSIRIWKSVPPFDCIKTIKYQDWIKSIIELQNTQFIVSGGGDNKTLVFWDNQTYSKVKEVPDVECSNRNSLKELNNENILLVGGKSVVSVINIDKMQLERKIILDSETGDPFIYSFSELENGTVLCGNGDGNLFHLNIEENKIISIMQKAHNDKAIWDLIILEDNQLISCSGDKSIKIWKY